MRRLLSRVIPWANAIGEIALWAAIPTAVLYALQRLISGR